MLWPIVRLRFLPTTFLWYTAVHMVGGQWTPWPIVGVVVALMIDLLTGARSSRATSSAGRVAALHTAPPFERLKHRPVPEAQRLE